MAQKSSPEVIARLLNVPTMQQPEVYIGNVATLFDANGVLNNEHSPISAKIHDCIRYLD